MMGATTSLLNPKLAMIFLSLLPQFIDYQHGSVLKQSLALGGSLIVAFATVNGLVAICSGSMATLLSRRPGLLLAQRWAMGTVLAVLGAHMCVDALKLAGRLLSGVQRRLKRGWGPTRPFINQPMACP